MPLYEYKCLSCGQLSERIESVAGPHLKKCPHCRGKVERLISPPAIQFKGSGWYVTDYAGKSSPPEASAAAGGKDAAKESASKETPGKESGSSKEASPKEKKPAKKK